MVIARGSASHVRLASGILQCCAWPVGGVRRIHERRGTIDALYYVPHGATHVVLRVGSPGMCAGQGRSEACGVSWPGRCGVTLNSTMVEAHCLQETPRAPQKGIGGMVACFATTLWD